jgi:hypothetical protein
MSFEDEHDWKFDRSTGLMGFRKKPVENEEFDFLFTLNDGTEFIVKCDRVTVDKVIIAIGPHALANEVEEL